MNVLSEYFVEMGKLLPNLSKVEATLLTEGFSNKVYLLRVEQVPRFVLRIPCIDCDAFFVNRKVEISTFKQAASVGLSPEIVWTNDKGGIVCEFVSQSTMGWTVNHKNEDVKRIALALAKAHKLPAVDHKYSVFDVIDHYLKQIQAFVLDDELLNCEYEYLLDCFQGLTQPQSLLPFVLCHNDLNPKNILMDDDVLWLIDWEYTGVGDPLFDLSVVAKSHNLNDEQMEILLSTYQASLPLQEARLAIHTYKQCYALREMAWLFLKHLIDSEDKIALKQYFEFKTSPELNTFHL
ncbi:phosphotransferase [Marinomonas sp. 5E14-1]|uniref:phosphotransferase n=1 Tax=Marinomonas sp. 5E14-1 TaxID=3153922 RepID=UPI003266A8EB